MSQHEMDALQRILADEQELEPMTGFSTRVMRAVREEASAPKPLAFPWTRFLPGFLLNLGLLSGAAVWTILELGISSLGQPLPAEWLSDPQALAWLCAALTLIGSGAAAWIATKWVAPERSASF